MDRLAFALAAAFGLATIAIGFYADDWALIATLEHKVPLRGHALDLYHWGSADPAETAAAVVRGPWPWWTHPEIKIHLLRPLASALFALDHALFGHAPLGYHLHAIAWWLLLVAAARAVLRRALPAVAASAALLLYVLDDGHVQPMGWISCRHMVVAGAPALLGLAAHLRFREDGWRPGRVLSLLGLAVGLAGSEAALGALAYVVAYELVGSRDAPARRLAAAAPALGGGVAYVAAYKLLGYGATASGLYVEPLTDPAGFVAAALTRVPVFAGDLLFSMPADVMNVAPPAPFVILGLVAAAVAAALARWAWPSLSDEEKASARWLALGALLGAAVGLAGFPGSRVLLLPGIGAFGLLGLLLDRALLREAGAPRAAKLAAALFAALHGVFSPLVLGVQIGTTAAMARGTERGDASLVLSPPLPKRVYVLVSSDPMGAFYASAVRAVRGANDFEVWSILSMAKRDHRVTRTGPRSFRLEATAGTLFDGGFVDVYRARAYPVRAGHVVELYGATVSVVADDGSAPTAIEVALDLPLDDPRVALVTWQDGGLRPVALGATPVELPWSPGPSGLF